MQFSLNNFPLINQHLASGKVAILPTDTIYGFSGDPSSKSAILTIQNFKKREINKPFLLLVPSLDIAQTLVHFSTFALNFAQKVWPGPCTIILPRKQNALPHFFPKEKNLAIRIPKQKQLLNFLSNYWNKPLISSSVNEAGEQALVFANEINNKFGANQQLWICTKKMSKKHTASTIIMLENKEINILRQGVLSRNKIDKIASQININI